MNLIADVSPVNFFLALYTFPNDPSPTKSSKLYSESLLFAKSLLLLVAVFFAAGGVKDDGD